MDGTLRIRLLGGFSVEVDGEPVAERAWRLRKARALVKLAALSPGRRVHRDVVAELLWADRTASAAANNLHQALHAARRALGDPAALTLSDDVLALTPGAWVDVEAFEAAAAAPDGLDAALAVYRGELLPEDRLEPWTEGRRAAGAGGPPRRAARAAPGPLHPRGRRAGRPRRARRGDRGPGPRGRRGPAPRAGPPRADACAGRRRPPPGRAGGVRGTARRAARPQRGRSRS